MGAFEELDKIADEVLPSQEAKADAYQITSNVFLGLGGFGAEQVFYHMEHGAAMLGSTSLKNAAAGFVCSSLAIALRNRSQELSNG